MTFVEVLILAIIQGLTEFLPVSSSGHLALFQTLFERWRGITAENATLDVMLHFGTLLATVFFFRKEIIELAKGIVSKAGASDSFFRAHAWRMCGLILAALIPTGAIGLFLEPFFEGMLHNLLLVGITLGVTAILLFSSRSFIPSKIFQTVSVTDAVIIGIAQGIAVLPGLSRSGTTIAVALMLGWEREDAFRFSFLISIPAIIGATLLKARHLDLQDMHLMGNYLIGMAVAGTIGYFSLVIVRSTVIGKKFFLFSFYCAVIAIIAIILAVI